MYRGSAYILLGRWIDANDHMYIENLAVDEKQCPPFCQRFFFLGGVYPVLSSALYFSCPMPTYNPACWRQKGTLGVKSVKRVTHITFRFSKLMLHFRPGYCCVLHCTALHWTATATALQCNCTALRCTAMQCTVWRFCAKSY